MNKFQKFIHDTSQPIWIPARLAKYAIQEASRLQEHRSDQCVEGEHFYKTERDLIQTCPACMKQF